MHPRTMTAFQLEPQQRKFAPRRSINALQSAVYMLARSRTSRLTSFLTNFPTMRISRECQGLPKTLRERNDLQANWQNSHDYST